eukprot:Plantae.Rhodophyta-Purpureofilum_apyrenoidigerum.ctg6177.p1 GENE.Plantae.Rhodophyta-Purpureofilum_apyrenoidigerum.ctg6177~~Plantae.Rhodophyta-Purpureofilum_apyrenoidigerum.ctg6177.p1  ORF type:complete len:766 (+),score=194.23 Plantae.Rhodophyta-Purpureofilum_apyrenoidigerum.ctg6177:117-2414(+)
MDGLKPSQRKVLFSCFKRKLRSEIKVAQLAGYVSEHSAYHHGEASLMATIIGLAQNFAGSNNLNLLYPAGQFGTRLQGGKDAASPRYIFTRLSKIARLLFPPEDDAILDYLEDDGLSIEPKFYAPVIPMVLVNGADGIGTGWSSSIPSFDPRVLIGMLRRLLDGADDEDLAEPQPWFRRHKGTVRKIGATSYELCGEVRKIDNNTLVITELPAKTWTTPYKEWLESMTVGSSTNDSKETPFLVDIRDGSTENTVKFTLELTDESMVEIEDVGIHKKLKLITTSATSNLVLFDTERRLKRYECAKHIIREFFELRLRLYEKRRLYLLNVLRDEVELLENRVRFIKMVIDGKLKIAKRKKAELIAELRSLKFKATKAKRISPVSQQVSTVPESSRPEDEDISDEETAKAPSENDSGYDYLLSMPLWCLTHEQVVKLISTRDTKVTEMEEMENTAALTLYRRDLDRLEAGLDEDDEIMKNEEEELAKAAIEATTKRKAGKGRKKNTAVEHEEEENLGDVVELPEVKIKVARRVIAKQAQVSGSTLTSKECVKKRAPSKSTALGSSMTSTHASQEVTELKPAETKSKRLPAFFRKPVLVEETTNLVQDDEERSDSDDDFSMSLTERLAKKMTIGSQKANIYSERQDENTVPAGVQQPKRGRQPKKVVTKSPPVGQTPEPKRSKKVIRNGKIKSVAPEGHVASVVDVDENVNGLHSEDELTPIRPRAARRNRRAVAYAEVIALDNEASSDDVDEFSESDDDSSDFAIDSE